MNEYARGVPDSPAEWGLLATILAVFGGAFLVRALWRKAKGQPVSTRRGEDPHGPTEGASKSAWKWWIGTGVAAYVVTVIVRIAMGESGTDVWLFPALVFPLCGVLLPARIGVLAWSSRKGREFRERRRHAVRE
ncbi:hypothetical protein B4N89_30325 [Embleya scabrispora]|uniref:Uncharacterized protein n=1 Tax=Embleya scabrispora TaxID=159449 RepID=A0A1T3P6C7_9ACTN|nr:hypothetical protein [Embleya scabrispora]OPC84649.1 hypothetical protein B4N89_30325 [Embleya scabrispora]